jgi:hypothetical protein
MDSLVPPSAEEFAHISSIQAHREAEHKKRRSRDLQRSPGATSPGTRHSSSGLWRRSGSAGRGDEPAVAELRSRAARLIQRTYRGYRVRRQIRGLGIDASTRWVHAIREAQFRELTRPRARSIGADGDAHVAVAGGPGTVTSGSTARDKWRKAGRIARRAGGDVDEAGLSSTDGSSSSEDEEALSSGSDDQHRAKRREAAQKRKEEARARRAKDARTMGLQYFLEMVDLKHRYGSNLRTYHEEWKKTDTNDNFFYWLDYGDGRFLDIEACPRERLDREQVRYLSQEERQYYLVKVDQEGRLCWAKNGVRIDTTEKWKDSIHGIVPADDTTTPIFQPLCHEDGREPRTSTSSGGGNHEEDASESELEAARAAKYATPGLDEAKGVKKIRHISATTVFNKLLRKSVRKNTWIFVADTSFRLYVGIKNSGAFQHSSFLQGTRISAAGLIKIRGGRLTSLSPLSGHYRPPASNFRAFVHSLRDEGVDMRRVSISKSYAVLVGLEAYVKTRRKGKEAVHRLARRADRVLAPEEARAREEAEKDKSESAALERKTIEREQRIRDENSVTVALLQKLRISPREPAGQKGGDDHEEENATSTITRETSIPGVIGSAGHV